MTKDVSNFAEQAIPFLNPTLWDEKIFRKYENIALNDPESEKQITDALKDKGLFDDFITAFREYVAEFSDRTKWAQTLRPPEQTDTGQARLFAEVYKDRLLYSSATGWLIYDGTRWIEDDIAAQGLVQQLTYAQIKRIRKELKSLNDEYDELVGKYSTAGVRINPKTQKVREDLKKKMSEVQEQRKSTEAFFAYVLKMQASPKIKATLTEARTELNIPSKVMGNILDNNPFLLNTPAGVVDLRTGEIREHRPQDHITKITTVSPSNRGRDIWLSFIDRLTCNDTELVKYLQLCSGMAIVGRAFSENLIIAYGSGGNGKSTFYNAQYFCLGDYAGNLSADTLTANSYRNKSPEYAELRGKRLVIAAELEEGKRLDTAIVKKLCSSDPIIAEQKYKAPFTFTPSHTIILYTNHLPKVGANDKGTWDRLVVIPFRASFRGGQGEIKNYAEYLAKHCGGAILQWMIEGAVEYIKAEGKISVPKCVMDAVEEYRQENDWVHDFVTRCCDESKDYTQSAGALYDAYRQDCYSRHEYARSMGDFKTGITNAGYFWKKTKKGAFYYGLCLKLNEPEKWKK